MVGILRTTHCRESGKCLSREMLEILDMGDKEYFKTIIEVEGEEILKQLSGINKSLMDN